MTEQTPTPVPQPTGAGVEMHGIDGQGVTSGDLDRYAPYLSPTARTSLILRQQDFTAATRR